MGVLHINITFNYLEKMQMSRQQPEIVQLFEVEIVLCHWLRMTREGDGHSDPWTQGVAIFGGT